jgi:hypothetical protein
MLALFPPNRRELARQKGCAYELGTLTWKQAWYLDGKRALFSFHSLPDEAEMVKDGDQVFLYCDVNDHCVLIVCLPDEAELPIEGKVKGTLRVEWNPGKTYMVYRLEEPIWKEARTKTSPFPK